MLKRAMGILGFVCLALLAIGAGGAAAQGNDEEVAYLSLDECLRTALANNLDLVSAQYTPELAEQDVVVNEANFDIALGADFEHVDQESTATQLSTLSGSKRDTYNAGVDQRLKFGGSYTAGFQMQHNRQIGANVVAPGSFSSAISATFNLPILKGFGTETTTENLLLAQNNLEISLTDLEGQAELVMEQVEGAYWNVVAAREALRVARLSLERADDLLVLNRKKVEVGTLAPIEITQAEAGVASQQEGAIVAETQLYDAEDELRRLLAIPDHDALWGKRIMNADKPVFDAPVVDLGEAIDTAIESRYEMRSARQAMRNHELSERVAKRQRKHQLDFDANYTPIGTDADKVARLPGPDGEIDTDDDVLLLAEAGTLGGSFGLIGDNHYWSAKLTYRVPIGNRAANAAYARARLSRERAEIDLMNQEQTIRVEVRKAARGVESGWKRVEAARVNVVLQQKKLDAEQKKFDNGMSTSFEVLTFQNDLADAELGQIRAALDYVRATVALERYKGTLLESRGLELTETY